MNCKFYTQIVVRYAAFSCIHTRAPAQTFQDVAIIIDIPTANSRPLRCYWRSFKLNACFARESCSIYAAAVLGNSGSVEVASDCSAHRVRLYNFASETKVGIVAGHRSIGSDFPRSLHSPD